MVIVEDIASGKCRYATSGRKNTPCAYTNLGSARRMASRRNTAFHKAWVVKVTEVEGNF